MKNILKEDNKMKNILKEDNKMKNRYYEIEMKIANNTMYGCHGYELERQIMAQVFLVMDYAIEIEDYDMYDYFYKTVTNITNRGIGGVLYD